MKERGREEEKKGKREKKEGSYPSNKNRELACKSFRAVFFSNNNVTVYVFFFKDESSFV